MNSLPVGLGTSPLLTSHIESGEPQAGKRAIKDVFPLDGEKGRESKAWKVEKEREGEELVPEARRHYILERQALA